MKLFLIIYASGQIGGVVGPLPHGLAECEKHRDEMRSNQAAFLADGVDRVTGKQAPLKNIEIAKNMRFECEFRSTRPKLGVAE